jgi:Zn-dependent peptidase ImmA (M78 family)
MMFHALSNDFRQQSEDIAISHRHKLGLQGYSPLPARTLATHLGVDIQFPYDLEGVGETVVTKLTSSLAWSGITILTEPPVVIVHPNHAATRFESDVMHELAHLLLGHKPEQLGWVTSKYASRSYSKRQEKEAEYLGGCLQITSVGLDFARRNRWNKAQIAQHFGASEQMVQYRWNMSG